MKIMQPSNKKNRPFLKKCFEVVNYRKWDNNKEKYGQELLLKNCPFTNRELLKTVVFWNRYETCSVLRLVYQNASAF